jgi:hypothetical protein
VVLLADLVESIKKAALDAVDNSSPCCLIFGKVIQESPLRIQVNTKLILEKSQLFITSIVSGKNYLKNGNEVVMIRQKGGQEYLVIDRVVRL